jgi:hypothetical protein
MKGSNLQPSLLLRIERQRPRPHLITVLMALKSALPLMLSSFSPHVNCILELIATSFHGTSVSAAVSTSSTGAGALTGLAGPAPVAPAVAAAAAAAAVAAIAGWTRLNL